MNTEDNMLYSIVLTLTPTREVDVRATMGHQAHAAFLETETGVLAPGRFADITVLSGDPTAGPPEALLELEPRLTVVGGEIRWRAGEGPRSRLQR